MNDDPASLSRLHDLVEPAPVSWWPLAPGWYVVIALAAVGAFLMLWRLRAHWRASAYRREALRELASADTVAGVSELLRRTALVVAPRPTVAALAGSQWPRWLSEQSPVAMPSAVNEALATAVYRPQAGDLAAVKAYAATWIQRHQPTAGAAS